MNMKAVLAASRRFHHHTQGAAYVEFLVAFMPLLVAFECLLQLIELHVANLVTAHAAQCASRAAAVVLPDDPKHYQGVPVGVLEGRRLQDVEHAAALPLRAVRGIISARLRLTDADGAWAAEQGLRTTTAIRVEATYHCRIPLARRLVCDPASTDAQLVATAPLILHGARYAYD
jgi:hypothetical protein